MEERYIEITDIIIPNIVENYNEYLPFIINMDSKKIRKIIEKIKILRMKDKHLKAIRNLIKIEIGNLSSKNKKKIKRIWK